MKQKLSGAALLLAACLGSCREAAAPQQQIGYSVLMVEPTNVTLTESYSASVRGRQDIEIYPQVSGTIQRVCVKEGEKVQRGQSLFIIDRVPYEAALRTAVANVHAAEAQVETARIRSSTSRPPATRWPLPKPRSSRRGPRRPTPATASPIRR